MLFGCDNAQMNLWGCYVVRPEHGNRVSENHSHMLLLLIALRALFSSLFSVAFLENTSDHVLSFCKNSMTYRAVEQSVINSGHGNECKLPSPCLSNF